MTELFTSQMSWAAGELTPRLWWRKDLEQNAAGAKGLENCRVWRQGGVFRRTGTKFVDTLLETPTQIDFVYSSSIAYELVITTGLATVYRAGAVVATFETPWAASELNALYWTQSFDVLFVAHPSHPIQVIKRLADDAWPIANFDYRTNDNFVEQPYWKYADTNAELDPSGTTGAITLVASEDFFDDPGHIGVRFRLHDGEVEVTSITDAQNASATVHENLDAATATKDWEEQAFSSYRGYPGVVEIHEQRLAIGGSAQLPNTIWLSESGDLYSFAPKDRGTGDVLATNAITFTIDANPGRTVWMKSVSDRLLIGTTDGESGVEAASTSEGLGPDNFAVRNYTHWGSEPNTRAVRVGKDVIHIQRGGFALRRLTYKFESDAVDSQLLTDISEHLVSGAKKIFFQATPEQTVWLLRWDGSVSALTYEPDQKVTAWTPISLGGPVAAMGILPEPDGSDDVYFSVNRDNEYLLEVLGEATDDPLVTPYLDCAVYGHSDAGAAVWGGLAHLEGKTVGVWADGFNHPDVVVSGGEVILSQSYNDVWVGLPYFHTIDFLAPNRDRLSMKAQLKHLLLYLLDTKGAALQLTTGEFTDEHPLFSEVDSGLLQFPWPGRTERDLGTIKIRSNEPYPFALIAATFIWTVNQE